MPDYIAWPLGSLAVVPLLTLYVLIFKGMRELRRIPAWQFPGGQALVLAMTGWMAGVREDERLQMNASTASCWLVGLVFALVAWRLAEDSTRSTP